jgi:hypothetical protein
MLRVSACRSFREIGEIAHLFGKNVIIVLDFDGVLMKDGWNSHALTLARGCASLSRDLAEKYRRLGKELRKFENKYPNLNDPSFFTEISSDLSRICQTLVPVNQRSKKIYHRVNNFETNRIELTDPSIPEVLCEFNKSGIPFFSLSANYDACSRVRSDQFDKLGLTSCFSKTFLVKGASTPVSPYSLAIGCNTVLTAKVLRRNIPEGTPEDAPCRFHGENPISPQIFWKNPGRYYAYFEKNCVSFSKGSTLKQLIFDRVIPQKPKRLVFVDDSKKNVEEVGNACLELGIIFHGIHFRSEQ